MAESQPHAAGSLIREDYFALEAAENRRYEYLAGEVFAMTGGTERHALLAMNTGAALVNAFRDLLCRVYGADIKLHIAVRETEGQGGIALDEWGLILPLDELYRNVG